MRETPRAIAPAARGQMTHERQLSPNLLYLVRAAAEEVLRRFDRDILTANMAEIEAVSPVEVGFVWPETLTDAEEWFVFHENLKGLVYWLEHAGARPELVAVVERNLHAVAEYRVAMEWAVTNG